jgi:hypothetical protein
VSVGVAAKEVHMSAHNTEDKEQKQEKHDEKEEKERGEKFRNETMNGTSSCSRTPKT